MVTKALHRTSVVEEGYATPTAMADVFGRFNLDIAGTGEYEEMNSRLPMSKYQRITIKVSLLSS